MSNTAPLKNASISIKPSQKLINYIKEVDVTGGLPIGISNIVFKNPVKDTKLPALKIDYLLTPEDRDFITTLLSNNTTNNLTELPLKSSTSTTKEKLLTLQDLHWLYNYINKNNKNSKDKIYLHELIEGSEIILPKNEEIPRNPELESRCRKLRAQYENKVYQDMTKSVDIVRKKYPEDTLAFQSKSCLILNIRKLIIALC